MRRAAYQIMCDGGGGTKVPSVASGWVHGCFGTQAEGYGRSKEWPITHIPTGYKLSQRIIPHTAKDAKAVMRALVRGDFDWDGLTLEGLAAVRREAREAVDAAVNEALGGD